MTRATRYGGESTISSGGLPSPPDGPERTTKLDQRRRLWHPWLRINRALRVVLQTRWSAEAWLIVRAEFSRAVALRSEIRRAGWFN